VSGMQELMGDVDRFEEAMGTAERPVDPVTEPEWGLVRLRAKLITEEYMETIGAMLSTGLPKELFKQRTREICADMDHAAVSFNIEEVADGLADLIYVCVGAALAFGIPLDRVWAEVQRANMDKVGGERRADGKILKPDGWVPPRIHEAIFGKTA
jgi:predicted HAD superfamily Cof-like phosphohydrolase